MDDDPDLPRPPPAKLAPEMYARMPPGWNNSHVEWVLPDYAYSRERYEQLWPMYQKCLKFEEENKFEDQSYMFLSDYMDLIELQKQVNKKKEEEEKANKEKKEEMIKLTRPIDLEDMSYVIDNYDYDPDDDVVNTFNETQAENFIRSKVIEYRKSIGKQI